MAEKPAVQSVPIIPAELLGQIEKKQDNRTGDLPARPVLIPSQADG